MFARSLVLATLCLGALSTSLAAQKQEVLPKAWGRLRIQVAPGLALPFGFLPDVTISLVASDGSYRASISTADADELSLAFKKGTFEFANVPTGVSCFFSLTYTGGNDDTQEMSGTFTFDQPDLNLVQEVFRRRKALEIAGYIGDFTIDIASGRIVYSNRYE